MSTTLYSGTTLARISLAKQALESLSPPRGFEGPALDPEGHRRPVLHGVIVADGGTLYTYTRGDRGGLAESVEHAVGVGLKAKPPMDPSVPDWQQEHLTAEEHAQWQAAQPRPGASFSPGFEEELGAIMDEGIDPPPPPEAGLSEVVEEAVATESAPKLHPFRRRFDHDLARKLRVEGVQVKDLAEHFGITRKNMYATLRGAKVNGLRARARFDKLAALKLRDYGVPFSGIAANTGANPYVLRAFFARIDEVA